MTNRDMITHTTVDSVMDELAERGSAVFTSDLNIHPVDVREAAREDGVSVRFTEPYPNVYIVRLRKVGRGH